MSEKVIVELGDRSYEILIGSGIRELAKQSDLLVTDSNVDKYYGSWAETKANCKYIFPAGEENKSIQTVADICRAAAQNRLSRKSVMTALGGGVCGDMTGFAAAIYMRGIDFVQIPTTLLAMVDSSVGGKTAVDIPEGKNLIGAFHQPRQVLIDTDFLKTLPLKEIRCGLAEIIKTGVILDENLFAELEKAPETLTTAPDYERYSSIIRRCCELKAQVVAADEKEGGLRAILNYGHTFGHAFELLSNFTLSHGEGVVLGMCAAGEYAAAEGIWSKQETLRQKKLIAALGLPTRLDTAYKTGDVIQAMLGDKKSASGKINLVLPTRIGHAEIFKDAAAGKIALAVESIYA